MFTFVSITYNHSEFILEHLDSIKYQINNYADRPIKLILCDDCSTDETYSLVTKWLLNNDFLFYEYTILKNSSNIGIVQNYLEAISLVNTEKYKILAGDDLYYSNNLFEIIDSLQKDEVIVSYPIVFSENKVKLFHTIDLRYITKKIKKLNNEKLKSAFLRDEIYINAPSSIVNITSFDDLNLINRIKKYKWIEDIPLWYELIIIKGVKFRYYEKPYILYRLSHGISHTKSKNDKYYEFSNELKNIKKNFNMRITNKNKYFVLSKYFNKFVIYLNRIWNIINFFNFVASLRLKIEVKTFLSIIRYTRETND